MQTKPEAKHTQVERKRELAKRIEQKANKKFWKGFSKGFFHAPLCAPHGSTTSWDV